MSLVNQRREEAELEQNWLDWCLENDGLLDPGQPTLSAHVEHTRAMLERIGKPFSPTERMKIRLALGITGGESH